jgi:uroporphyrin-III C-methyltransferase/precorrin-2 dehydrogenase/sirohydrochlorin ferrochelatase
MQPLARLPLFVDLARKRAVLAGGNVAAAWKAELLSAAGARVDVFSAEMSNDMLSLAAEPPGGAIVLHLRDWEPDDLPDAALAVGAIDADSQASRFAAAARGAGIPVNVIDKPAFCDFTFGAIVNRSPLVVGISTDGAAPVFAQVIRTRIEALIPAGFARWVEAAKTWRETVKASNLPSAARRRFWQLFADRAVTHPDREPGEAECTHLLATTRGEAATASHGCVTLVGAGPGDPELLTLRAVRALQSADIILIDDLVAPAILDFARREAKKMMVGKTGFGPSCRQDEINALMVSLAASGKRVVRLKGGDALIFGRAGEEIEACRVAGIPVEVVPGITAAQGAAASLGVSLTQREVARRVQYITGHGADGRLPKDIDWASLADRATTTVVYMPKRTLTALSAAALAHGIAPDMPALAVIAATRPEQTVVFGTISDIATRLGAPDPTHPVIVMIGRAMAEAAAVDSARMPAKACIQTFLNAS